MLQITVFYLFYNKLLLELYFLHMKFVGYMPDLQVLYRRRFCNWCTMKSIPYTIFYNPPKYKISYS